MKSDEAMRQQQEFNHGVDTYNKWLEQAEPLVLHPSPCNSWMLKEHAQRLDVSTTVKMHFRSTGHMKVVQLILRSA